MGNHQIHPLQSYEEAVLAMDVVRPVMLVSDDSYVSWYSKLQQNGFASLRWHVLMDSSSEFVSTNSNANGVLLCMHFQSHTYDRILPELLFDFDSRA